MRLKPRYLEMSWEFLFVLLIFGQAVEPDRELKRHSNPGECVGNVRCAQSHRIPFRQCVISGDNDYIGRSSDIFNRCMLDIG